MLQRLQGFSRLHGFKRLPNVEQPLRKRRRRDWLRDGFAQLNEKIFLLILGPQPRGTPEAIEDRRIFTSYGGWW